MALTRLPAVCGAGAFGKPPARGGVERLVGLELGLKSDQLHLARASCLALALALALWPWYWPGWPWRPAAHRPERGRGRFQCPQVCISGSIKGLSSKKEIGSAVSPRS